MQEKQLKHLFQQEFSKMVAVISKTYGLQHIELAEDIVSETFLLATGTWEKKGIPANPTAWLYLIAKQKAIHYFRRNKVFEEKVVPEWKEKQQTETEGFDFSPQYIKDSQLQMLFAICNPAIASEAQIGLALRILCGFGIDEIAAAFLSNKETINKRLFRAKEKLREESIKMILPDEQEISERVDTVLHIIYLLFSEGYYSNTQDKILQKELCIEALRLGLMLTDYQPTNLPKTNALIALMCFHASRFAARSSTEDQKNNTELFIDYEEQNEQLWDQELIAQGIYFLDRSVQGHELSSYHLEAKIAYWHCMKEDTPEKWEEILQLYNQLLLLNYSPSVALNRTFALYKANGWEIALTEANKLQLQDNHFYHLLLAELYKHNDLNMARLNFEKAYQLAKTKIQKEHIARKIQELT